MTDSSGRSDLEVLAAARARLSDSAQWTRGYFARTVEGGCCSPRYEEAVAWDVIGAVKAESTDDAQVDRICDALDNLAGEPVQWWQDAREHTEVLELLDAAVQLWAVS